MQKIIEQIRDRVLGQTNESLLETAIARVSIAVVHQGGDPEVTMCDPGICLVLQGTKTLTIGDQTLRQSPGVSFASLVELPATRCVYETERREPYVATGLTIDQEALISLLGDIGPVVTTRQPVPSFSIEDDSYELLEAWNRYLALFDKPDDIPGLAVPRERELLYRLLKSPHGTLLQQIVKDHGRIAQIRRAIDLIRTHFEEPLPIKVLADVAGMSVAAFNRHFKTATSTSPLQYQKTLRLQTAQQLLAKGNDATRAAYAVGYGSVSQFTREYGRYFGRPPKQDSVSIRNKAVSGEP